MRKTKPSDLKWANPQLIEAFEILEKVNEEQNEKITELEDNVEFNQILLRKIQEAFE